MNRIFKNTMWYYHFAIISLLLNLSFAMAGVVDQAYFPSLDPDQKAQEEISNFIATAKSNSLDSEEKYFEAMDAFFATNLDREEVDLVQLLLLYGGEEEHKTNPQSEMLKRVMIFHYVSQMDSERVIATIAPLLDETTNPDMLKSLGCRWMSFSRKQVITNRIKRGYSLS